MKFGTAKITSTDTRYLHHMQIHGFDMETDEPRILGGGGAAPAPFDYYLASLGACTAITLRMYAERKGWDLGEFRAELALTFDEGHKPHVHRTLHASGQLTDEQWTRLLEIVANTPVTRAMRDGAVISSERGTTG